jgi:hypothetical protein
LALSFFALSRAAAILSDEVFGSAVAAGSLLLAGAVVVAAGAVVVAAGAAAPVWPGLDPDGCVDWAAAAPPKSRVAAPKSMMVLILASFPHHYFWIALWRRLEPGGAAQFPLTAGLSAGCASSGLCCTALKPLEADPCRPSPSTRARAEQRPRRFLASG